MKRFLHTLFVLGFCFSFSLAYAGGGASPTPKPAPKHVVIKTISSSGVSISTGAVTKDYKITKNTVFTYQGRRVAQEDIKPGMRVTVTPGFDGLTASLVAATDAPVQPAATATATATPAPKKK